MKHRLKNETGSAMVLALLFLLFCTLTGSALLASAAANGARSARQAQSQAEFLACRSGLLVIKGELTEAGLPQLTIRDVTVREKKQSRRTVTYILQNCGDSMFSAYLISRAVSQYEAEKGAPDERIREGFPFPAETAEEPARELTMEWGGDSVLCGLCTVSDDLTLTVELGGEETRLHLRMAAVTGTGAPVKLSANGVTTTTKTTVVRWENPVIEKGDGNG